MRNMVMSAIIGIGIMVGFGFGSNVNACDSCTEEVYEVYVTQEELRAFDCYVWNELFTEAWDNYCEECNYKYYRHCSCECREELGNEFTNDDELDCWEYDYMLFIEDNYDMIMDEFMRYVIEINEPVVVNEPMIIYGF